MVENFQKLGKSLIEMGKKKRKLIKNNKEMRKMCKIWPKVWKNCWKIIKNSKKIWYKWLESTENRSKVMKK